MVKHMILMGPALMAALGILGLLSLGLQKALDWAKE